MHRSCSTLRILVLMLLIAPQHIFCDQHGQAFTHIYDTAIWGWNHQGEPFSGGGSLLENCLEYIGFLQNFMRTYNIRTVVDAGCGDWEFSRYVDWTGVRYHGFDVVKSVIDKDIARYQADNITFTFANIIETELPRADLLICKHVLQHLRNEDIIKFSKQFAKYTCCLITNEVEPETLSSANEDIEIGGGRKVDLARPPFNIPGKPIFYYAIGGTVPPVFFTGKYCYLDAALNDLKTIGSQEASYP